MPNDQGSVSALPAEFQTLARRADLSTYVKLFPWCCLVIFLEMGVTNLLLDPEASFYSDNIVWASRVTGALAFAIGIWALGNRTEGPAGEAIAQIRLGAVLIICMAVYNALLLIDTGDLFHIGNAAIAMISVGLIYPRVIGVLLISLPQLAVVLWLANNASWSGNWVLGFFLTFSSTNAALLAFYTRRFYLRRHRALLAERDSILDALRAESIERTLLQERVLTERNLSTLGRLAGGIAHDLNNILVPILGNAAMLEESVQTSTHQRQAREVIQAASRARNLTQQLSYFATRGNAELETLNLNQLLSELSPIVWRTFPQGVDIDLRLPQQATYLHTSRTELQDLLTNLLLDAGNAAPVGGSVVVTVTALAELPQQFAATASRQFCAVTIADGAQPLNEEQRATILEPIQNIDGNNRSIGLLGTRDGAAALGGHIDIGTAAAGGNMFSLYLPVKEIVAENPAAANPHIIAGVAPEVLVVDDEPAVRKVTVALLRRAGFILRSCDSGEKALEEIAGHLPDAIIMDLRMPGMGGRAAAEAIRKANPKLPIVVSTGFTGDADGWLAQLPHTALLQKPFDTQELISAVKTLLKVDVAGE